MRLAYLILAHAQPLQLARLVNALRCHGAVFFVHIDAKSDISPFLEALCPTSHDDVHFVDDRAEVYWGGFGQIEATLRLMRDAMSHVPDVWRLSLISGSCYPLASNEELMGLCERPANFISMHAVDPEGPGYERISRFHLLDHPALAMRMPREEIDRNRPLRRYINDFLNHLPPREGLGLQYFKGSQWWSITRETAQYVLEFCERRPEYLLRFRYSWIPDESFFHTIIGNASLSARRRSNLHFIDWSRDSVRNKKVLTEAALPRILGSGRMFVRKVDQHESGPLMDRLDEIRANGRRAGRRAGSSE